MTRNFIHRALGATTAILAVLLLAGIVTAHTVEHAGPYTLEIGWQHEPTYVGESNGVQIIVSDADDQPVNDLTEDDVKVVVSTADQQSGELAFQPAFDLEEGEGEFGQYNAPIVPTEPGDYTFHLTGSIHGQAVDITVTSGDETFDTVKSSAELQFPTKLPTLTELVTRLDRIDARLGDISAPTQEDVDAASQAATDAKAAADRALLVGGGIGLLGVLIGAWSLMASRRGAAVRSASS